MIFFYIFAATTLSLLVGADSTNAKFPPPGVYDSDKFVDSDGLCRDYSADGGDRPTIFITGITGMIGSFL